MKKLKPTLPKDEKELAEKGFAGNISGAGKFITDGHQMFQRDDTLPDRVFKKSDEYDGKPPKLESIQEVWTEVERRKGIPAFFLGCGVVSSSLDEKVVVAVVRDEKDRIVVIDPYILSYAVAAVRADALSSAAEVRFFGKPLALLREGRIVALVMPMRFSVSDLSSYDLTGPAVELNGGVDAVS